MPSKQFYRDNRERYLKYSREYRKNNPKEIKKYDKQYKKDNPERIRRIKRDSRIKKIYGLSHKDWLGIWEAQDGECAICGRSFSKPSDALIDHNHKTNEVRGLLCNKCNLGIGHFDDNPRIIIKANEYLSKWE